MPSDVHLLIPAVPTLVVPAVAAFAILLWRLRRRHAATWGRVLLAAALVGYGVGVLRSVLVPFGLLLGDSRAHLAPVEVFVQPIPLVGADPQGIALNVLLFVPLGVLLPLLLRRPSTARVVGVAALTSLAIELLQLLTDATISTGRVADIDDLIANTIGALLGAVLFRLAVRLPAVGRLARAARWPDGPDQSAPSTSGASPRRRTLSTR